MAKRKKTTLGVVHVTATNPKTNLTPASLEAMHKARGFTTTGYNEWIDKKGKLHVGRGIDEVGAHVAGFNSIAYGIALEGGVNAQLKGDISTITSAQWNTLEKRMKEVSKIYPQIEWCGHRDLSPDKNGNGIIESHEWLKECPCFDAIPYAQSLGLKGANIKGNFKLIQLPHNSGIAETNEPIYEGPDTRVRYLQRLLTRAGFPLGDDGIIGDKTKAAIKSFQTVHGLKQTSTFDTATVALLRELAEGPTGTTGTVSTNQPASNTPEIEQKPIESTKPVVVVPATPPIPTPKQPATQVVTVWDWIKSWF